MFMGYLEESKVLSEAMVIIYQLGDIGLSQLIPYANEYLMDKYT